MQQHRELVPYCLDKKSNSASPNLSAFALAKSIIDTICAIIPFVYIVIDGLDECQDPEHRKSIVNTFAELVKSCDRTCQGKLRVLFLSRPLPEVDKTPLTMCADNFSLAPEDNEKDIERYCRKRFQSERELQKFKLSEPETNAVVDITCTRAHGEYSVIFQRNNLSRFAGMFLFAKLVLNNLKKQPNKQAFFNETVTARFPKDLNEA